MIKATVTRDTVKREHVYLDWKEEIMICNNLWFMLMGIKGSNRKLNIFYCKIMIMLSKIYDDKIILSQLLKVWPDFHIVMKHLFSYSVWKNLMHTAGDFLCILRPSLLLWLKN